MQRLTITIWTISKSAVFRSVLQGTITWAAKRFYGWSQSAITCSKLPIETLEQGVKYLWTYFTRCSSVCIVNFEQVNTCWVEIYLCCKLKFWKFEPNLYEFGRMMKNYRNAYGCSVHSEDSIYILGILTNSLTQIVQSFKKKGLTYEVSCNYFQF